jgi:ribosomal protein S18 acetylase RimI-like enzyme
VAEQVAFIRTLPPRAIYHAAVDEADDVLGIQDVLPADGAGEISTFVRLDAHRRGIGRALTEATLTEARARGFARIRASVRVDNLGAIAFYLGQGFDADATAFLDAKLTGTVRLLRVLDERC